MPRKYDTVGRDMLAQLCTGVGLDIGCHAQKIMPSCIGVDNDPSVSPDMLADMDNLDVPDNTYDYVVASHVLEHTHRVKETLLEWFRVLKTQGLVGVVVPHGEYAHPETLGDASGGHHQLFTVKTLELFLRCSGFVHVVVTQYDRPTAYQQAPGIFAMGMKP
jgi:SAM-dependent methyltransferase